MADEVEIELGGRTRSSANFSRGKVSHVFILLALAFSVMTAALLFSALSRLGSNGVVDWAVVVSFIFNGVFSCYALIKDAVVRPYSLIQIHWLFFLAFFVVAPLSQYASGYLCWDYLISDASYLNANILLFVWAVIFFACSTVGVRHSRTGEKDIEGFFERLPQVSRSAVAVFVLLSVIATAAIIFLVGFENLFSRSTFSLGLDQTIGLLLEKVLRCTPLFAFAFVFVRFEQCRDCLGSLVLCGVLLLLADFPFGMARYNAAAVYGGLLLLCVPLFKGHKGLFPLFFLFLFLVVFPASNVFRHNEFDLGLLASAIADVFVSFGEGFSTEDYDAYSMFVRSVDYVSMLGATDGAQLCGALLFFIPRSIWPGKPVGSGVVMAIAQGQAFTNISCPLPAEGIMNFGFVGLFLFAAIIGKLCRKIDDKGSLGGWAVFYPFLCFLFFFMLRGDMLSSFAYVIGFAAVYLAMFFFVSSFSRLRGSRLRRKGIKEDLSGFEGRRRVG